MGDVIDVRDLMNSAIDFLGGNPFDPAQGYLHLPQNGPDTLVQFNQWGSANNGWQTVLTLQGISANTLTAENFKPTMAPDGSVTVITITGTVIDDQQLDGGFGDDSISGLAGSDTLTGYSGADTLVGGDGFDRLNGGAGNDLLIGGAQGSNADTNYNDLYGEDGDDVLQGGNYVGIYEYLSGGNGNDSLYSNAGGDILYGEAGNDVLDGGAGNDDISGGTGNNTLLGGDGDDRFVLNGDYNSRTNTETDLLTGGAGKDCYVIYSYDLATKTVTDFAVGATGDVIDVSLLLTTSASFGYSSGNPLDPALGYLRLVQKRCQHPGSMGPGRCGRQCRRLANHADLARRRSKYPDSR